MIGKSGVGRSDKKEQDIMFFSVIYLTDCSPRVGLLAALMTMSMLPSYFAHGVEKNSSGGAENEAV